MEIIKWIFGFLFFHRRIILGLALVIGLLYWLRHGKEMFPNLSSASRPDIMLAEIDDSEANGSSTEAAPSNELTEQDLLEKGSGAELVAELLRLGDRWPNQRYPVVYLTVSKQKQIAERLMQMEISNKRMKFATLSYLESVSLLDSVNVQSSLGVKEARGNLVESSGKFLKNPDDDIRSLAHLMLTVYPGYDFLASHSAEDLKEFENAIETHFDQLSVSIKNCEKLAELVTRVLKSDSYQEETKQVALNTLERLKVLAKTGSRELTLSRFEERIHFARLELPTIVDRMSRSPLESADDVHNFQRALRGLPNVSVNIFQIALDVIREYIHLGEIEKARQFYVFIEQDIAPLVEDEEMRKSILDALSEFARFL